MCGIVGISGGDLSMIEHANSLNSHRGPDDNGLFMDHINGVGLGHRRLSIIDTSNLGHQPMLSKDGKVALVFNGEIYNFSEIFDELVEKGFSFNGKSDTEVLLNLYLSEGDSMLSRLNGIFTFAIWDQRKKHLFIARDAIGVKPLYYYSQNNLFAFSSEIKSLLHLIPNNNELDKEAIHNYVSFLWSPGIKTPIKSIQKLLPGEAIIVKDDVIEKKWFWYSLPILSKSLKKLSKNEAISGVENHLRAAVHKQMVSDVSLGAFLSGGLDSSAIVAFAREINPDIKCFTIDTSGSQDPGFTDDLPYAKKVAKYLNVPLDIIKVNSNNIADDLESMVMQLDEPLADPAALNVLYISRLAKEQGIKVLLSGAGGDDIFTGYRRHLAIELDKYWGWMPERFRSHIEHISKNLNVNRPFTRRISKLFEGASLDKDLRLINYFRWTDDKLLKSLYSKEFCKNLNLNNCNDVFFDFLRPITKTKSQLEKMLAIDQRFFLADHNLNYTDKMSMAEGVETRVPFLDLDLINFSNDIPEKFKQNGSTGKWVLKKAMEPYLPKEVIYRPKTGFGVPVRRWIKHDLSEMLADFLSFDSVKRRGIFSPFAIQQLIINNKSDKIDASYTLLSLLCIEIWCRTYLD
jgi:asparagine synthase (glutamine-hydrolysing)